MESSSDTSTPPDQRPSAPDGRPAAPLLWIAITGVLISAVSFLGDKPVITWVATHVDDRSYNLAFAFSRWGDFPPIAAVLLVLLILSWMLKRRFAVRILCLMLGSAIASGIVVNILRVVSGRSRPSTPGTPGWYGMRLHGHWIAGAFPYSSFPSAHTAVAIACIVPLWLLLRGPARPALAIPVTLLALGVAASRILLNFHHLSDIVTSICIATVITTAICNRYGGVQPARPSKSSNAEG